MLKEEIRINQKFASICEADYGDQPTDDNPSEPIIRTRMLSTKRYLNKLTSNVSREQILPANTRFHERFSQGDLFVIEDPPSLRSIMIDVDMWGVYQRLKSDGKIEEYGIENYMHDNERPYRFTLAFPYTIFIIAVNRDGYAMANCVFFRTQPLVGLSDHILMAPLYNIPESQYMCLGSEASKTYTSPTAVAINSINVFWGAKFCADYTYNVQQYGDVPGVCDYFTWEHLSRTNPMFVYTAHWKKFGESLFQFITNLKQSYNLTRSYEMMNYKSIRGAFINPEPTDIEKTSRGGYEYRLFDNISNGVFLKNTEQLNVGDSFILANGKVGIVETFLGNQDGDAVTHMNIITSDGQKKLLKLSSKFKNYIYDRLMEERYVKEATILDGQVLKSNDIIKVPNKLGSMIYKKVKYIRKAPDDELEILMGTDYYLASNIKTVERLDIKEPEIGDLKLKKDTPYFIYNRQSIRSQPYREAAEATFEDLDVNDNGRILARFRTNTEDHLDYRTVQINTDNNKVTTTRVVPLDDKVRPLDPVFRLGRKIWGSYNEDSRLSSGNLWGTPDGIVYRRNTYSEIPSMKLIYKHLVNDDRFASQSFDYDIDFSIGDLVVVANWNDPNDLLSVKEIEGFKMTNDEERENRDGRRHSTIDFVLKKRDGTLITETFVDEGKVILTGKIRKVTTKLGDLEVGMKIIPKEAGICNFPKKDTNIIVAFVIDGGHEPLVLCSNACTLWISDVEEKFEIIPRSSDKWESHPHAPIELDKIKFQPGDLIRSAGMDFRGSQGYTVFRNLDNRGLRAHPNEYYHSSPEQYTMDSYFRSSMKLDCIPLPRLMQKQQDELGVIAGYPNFHGAVTPSINARLYFLNEGRTIINV